MTLAEITTGDEVDSRRRVPRVGFGETVWLIVLGLSTALPVPFVGNVAPASLVLLLIWGFFSVGRRVRYPEVLWLSVLGAATIVATLVWNLYFETPLPEYDVVSTAVFVGAVAALGWISLPVEKAMLLAASSASGAAVYYAFSGTALTKQSVEFLWKYGIANYVTVAALIFATWFARGRVLPSVVLVLAGSISLFTGFRSHGMVCFASVVVVLVVASRMSARARLVRMGVAVALLLALAELGKRVILSGLFGEYVQSRAASQELSGVPTILSGRVELPLSFAQVTSSPLVGIGNVDAISPAVIDKAYAIAFSWGLRNTSYFENQWFPAPGQISVHSVFFATWIEAGIVGAAFIGFLLFLIGRSFLRVYGRWAPVIAYVSFNTVWDLLFSPWSAKMAFVMAVSVMALFVARRRNIAEETAELRGGVPELSGATR